MTDIPSHIGLRIDSRYLIEAKLGSGGMGTVYRATRLLIGDTVAIKILHPGQVDDLHSVERFRREAQAAARLKHPNVVPIYDFGVSSEGLVYIAMELVEGKSIRDMLREQGPFAPQMAAEIVAQVCSALEAAHKKNIVHRDIKPDNIVVDATPTGTSVKVLDFGIAWMRDAATADLTETGNVVGTPHYMSPEQCLGEEPDPRSDIYSLGIVLFEMLAGVVPFNSRVATAVVIQHVNERPPSLRALNKSVPPAVESVVMQALAKQRDQRPQSAVLLAAQLAAAAGGHPVRANRPDSVPDKFPTTAKMPMPDWGAARQSSRSRSMAWRSRSWIWASASVAVLAGGAWVFLTMFIDSGPVSRPESAESVIWPKSDSESSKYPTHPPQDPTADSGEAPGNTGRPAAQAKEDDITREPTADAKTAVDPARALGARIAAGMAAAAREATAREGGAGDSATRKPAPTTAAAKTAAPQNSTRNSVARNTSVSKAAQITAAPSSVAPTSLPAKDVAVKEETPRELPIPKPNLAALATQAAGTCVEALRSNSVARMAQLYPAATAEDQANREKLLAKMSEAASRLSVAGSPEIGPAQTSEDSAYADVVVRLTWRGNFGQRVTKATRFRATIARTESDSHISCRIIGNAAL